MAQTTETKHGIHLLIERTEAGLERKGISDLSEGFFRYRVDLVKAFVREVMLQYGATSRHNE